MTKQELIKGILELSENLKTVEGMGALVEINEMELLIDKYTQELGQTLPLDSVMSFDLSEKEIKIAKIQSAMKKLGYQWQEHQFNDGFDEVYIEITKDKDPCAIDRHKEEAGWGRMGRLTAWTQALEWALQRYS